MFEKHFGLRENPFHSGHQLRFLYPSREHQEARAHLRYGIENREPFVLITGEVGTGKTTALYDALAEWGTKVAVALITNSALTRQELIEEICLRFGLNVPPGASKPQSLSLLERHLTSVRSRSEYAVLLLDEAQNLAPELLEEIRLLSNLEVQGERLLQIFLVGQPELEAQLAAPQLRQLRQRISVHYRLNPLSPEETGAYVHHRIAVAGGNPWAIFPPDSCREVYRITHGIPREINTVASAALIAAFSEGVTTVQPEHVHAITRESDFRSVLTGPSLEPGPSAPRGGPVTPPPSLTAPPPPAPAAPWPERFELPSTPVAPPPAGEPMSWPPEPEQEPEPVAMAPAPAPAPPSPEPVPAAPPIVARVEGATESTPAWTPPELGEAPPAAPPRPAPAPLPEPEVAFREAARVVDAWTAAAQELMEARRRNAPPEEPTRVEVVAPRAPVMRAPVDPPAPTPEPVPAYTPPPAPEAPEHFPTPAELFARAETANPENADLSGLPQRLRDKIAADIAAEEQREAGKRRAVPLVLAAITVAAVALGAVMLQKFQVIDVPALRGIAGTRAASQAASAPVEPRPQEPVVRTLPAVPPPAPTDSARHRALARLRDTVRTATAVKPAPATANASPAARVEVPPVTTTPAPATSTPARAPAKPVAAAVTPARAPATTPATGAATPPATTTTAARPAAPKPAAARADSIVYGLGVASYLDRDRAEQERSRLGEATGLPATIVPFNDTGTTKFRVVLGHYPSNGAAENAAVAIMEKFRVSEARPLVLARIKR